MTVTTGTVPFSPRSDVIDVTTTSVGRRLVRDTYASFFRHAKFDGTFRFFVTVDPAYRVDPCEWQETLDYLHGLRAEDDRVESVTVRVWPAKAGLQQSLHYLFACTSATYGVHLEDDWSFHADVDLAALIDDLATQQSTMIAFRNSHVSKRGTFDRAAEVEVVTGTRVPLLRLVPPSWASDYLPLCPHLHRRDQWVEAYAGALLEQSAIHECPDEIVREHVRTHGLRAHHNMLWTRDIVVRDTGREWLTARDLTKDITPADTSAGETPALERVAAPLDLRRSEALLARATLRIPGQTQTYMKRAEHFAPGRYPAYVERGAGAFVWDVDGNHYVDFVASLGAASLGHAAPSVSRAIRAELRRGVIHSLPSPLELDAADLVASIIPGAEQVRFLKTGADVCCAAVRLARLHTGRTLIATCGYHGWHETVAGWSPGSLPSAADSLRSFDPVADPTAANSLETLFRENGQAVAAVLIAPPYAPPLASERFHAVRRLCDEHGALLILDEIVTGFRLSLGGAQAWHDVRADLTCLGKGLGGGMPIAALCGPRAVMHHLAGMYVSSTHGGDTLSLAAVIAAINEYATTDYFKRLWSLGTQFRDGILAHCRRLGLPALLDGYAPIPTFCFTALGQTHEAMTRIFLAECAERGYLFRRDVNFIMGAHREEHISGAVKAAGEALAVVARLCRVWQDADPLAGVHV